MPYYILKPQNFKTTVWSGGTTTELMIYPKGSSYKEKNFTFRLSTATVETESSEFTSLPGVDRTLLVLDGEMKLIHQGHHESILKKGESDHFSGDWETSSVGKCKDFNLMTLGTSGSLQSYFLKKGQYLLIRDADHCAFRMLYVVQGKIAFGDNNESLSKEELLVLTEFPFSVLVRAIEESFCVLTEVSTKESGIT